MVRYRTQELHIDHQWLGFWMSQRTQIFFPTFILLINCHQILGLIALFCVQFATFLLLRMVLNISKSKSPKAHVINFATENLYLIEAVL